MSPKQTPEDYLDPKPDPLGRPTAEMLLTLPAFITGGRFMIGAPCPITRFSDGETVHFTKDGAE